MKKLFSLFFLLSIICLTVPVGAQPEKLIQLKDGSNLTGQVLGLVDGVYTIRTENLGTVKIQEVNILTISNKNVAAVQTPVTVPSVTEASSPVLTKADLNSKMQVMQQDIMSNPALMSDIQAMTSDPELIKILSDQSFIQSLMSMDIASIEKDPRFKQLLENEKIRSFVEKVKNTQNQ